MNVEDVMTTTVTTVTPEALLKDVAETLTEHGISGVPVCDTEGRVLGVVSEGDILVKEEGRSAERGRFWWLHGGDEESAAKIAARTAGEAMTSPAITIGPLRHVSEAARLMVERKVNRLPVVKDGELVGIVTRADLVRAFHRTDEEIEREIREDVIVRTLWISPEPITIAVEQGEVSLAGEIENRAEAELIDAFVRRVPGVVGVHSELTWRFDDLAARSERIPRRV